MPPYPTAADAVAAVPTLLSILSGNAALAPDLHAGYVLEGYGLSVVFPDQSAAKAKAKPAKKMTNKQALEHVKSIGPINEGNIASLDWAALLPLIVKFILSFFGV
ncbi:MAG TPA: hypothetical protein VGZ25_07395 [Gemmataceae bacterium]|jgi:hypothetical protein|nr:hypothetical protein [Gemmataceae bacterium]